MVYAEITWIFVCAIPLAILVGYGLGANDVANSFAPSVGAKALTMRQAVLVAAVFEFAGALLMGAGVTSTIRSGITNIAYFYDQPDVLAYGMMCAMLATGVWMMFATYWELPVSSTQSIVASIAGMAIVAEGWDAVVWSAEKDTFPYLKGMSAICLSWLFSPILAGFFAFILFFAIRALVLRSSSAYTRSIVLLPIFTFLTFYVVTFFVITKAGLQFNWQSTPNSKKAWISAIVAAGTCLISIVVGIPLLKRKVQRDLEAVEAAGSAPTKADVKGESDTASDEETGTQKADAAEEELAAAPHMATPAALQKFRESRMWKAATAGINEDIHQVVETDAGVREIHDVAEVFDHKAELSFKYLQVCTACANAFAHGSNEVANSVGPLAAIYQIWQDTAVSKDAEVPTWLLAVGGVAIVLGLATYGYKVMRALGVKMTKLTNARGFCVELSTATVVILASRFDLPNSGTPATVGAITGVGLLERRRGFNWRLLCKFVAGWVVTIIMAVLLTMAFTAQGLYAPNKTCASQRAEVGAYLNATSNQMAAILKSVNSAQAEAISAATAQQQVPIVSLIPPMNTQNASLAYYNASVCQA